MSKPRRASSKSQDAPEPELRPAPTKTQKVRLIIAVVLLIVWLAALAWMAIG